MNKVLKKALGFVGALGLTAVMVLVAAPVQAQTMAMEKAPSVEDRIKGLEAEIAKLKQGQESAQLDALAQALGLLKQDLAKLKAEQKEERITAVQASIDQLPSKRLAALEARAAQRPSFGYRPGGGVTVAAADNNWSIRFTQRLQVYHSIWLSKENPDKGYQNLELRVRRFRPSINVTSQQGFYAVTWILNSGSDGTAFGGDGYINFDKLNPYLPQFGWGYSPSFKGNTQAGAFRTEDSPLLDGLGIGGQQDGSFVLSWTKLPGMGISKITHLQLAWGQDGKDEAAEAGESGNSVGFALGLKPLAGAKGMGGLSVSNLSYSVGYQAPYRSIRWQTRRPRGTMGRSPRRYG